MLRPALVLTACAVAFCVLVGLPVWRRLQRDAARSRLASGRVQRRVIRGARLGALAARIAPRRSASGERLTAGSIAALLDQIARHCSSGQSLGAAFLESVATSPIANRFTAAVAALRSGDSIADALDRLTIDSTDLALAVHVLRLSASQGGNVSESLDRAAATLREREAVAQERLAQSSQARLSARVLTVLPVAFGGWTLLTTSSVRRFFLTPIGIACLLLGLALNLSGWMLMRRVTRGMA